MEADLDHIKTSPACIVSEKKGHSAAKVCKLRSRLSLVKLLLHLSWAQTRWATWAMTPKLRSINV